MYILGLFRSLKQFSETYQLGPNFIVCHISFLRLISSFWTFQFVISVFCGIAALFRTFCWYNQLYILGLFRSSYQISATYQFGLGFFVHHITYCGISTLLGHFCSCYQFSAASQLRFFLLTVMSTPLIIAKRRHSASEARSTPQLNAISCVDEPHKVNNFSFSPSTCLELVDKLTDNQIDHEFKRIEHLFTGRKTKKAKRDYLRAACGDSAAEFITRWETELENVNTLLSQLDERLRTVENLSYKFDKIDDFTSNLCNLQPTSENLVKSDKNDTSVIYSDPRLSSAIQDPPSSLLNPLTVCEQNVNVINLSDVLPECAFKRGFNIEECYFGKVSLKMVA